jgi:hypothetical protein
MVEGPLTVWEIHGVYAPKPQVGNEPQENQGSEETEGESQSKAPAQARQFWPVFAYRCWSVQDQ